jgi:hypothetical protein
MAVAAQRRKSSMPASGTIQRCARPVFVAIAAICTLLAGRGAAHDISGVL